MSDNQTPRADAWLDDEYREFERKMELIENGPTTTNFAQLIENGVQLPEPDSVSDADIRTKLWEVIAGLSSLRVYLTQTDHLSDRDLYAKLWREVLRTDVPAIDEIGFNDHVDLLWGGGEHEPPHEGPSSNRDPLLPRPDDGEGPEALGWLRANPNPSALATNRFSTTEHAVRFVEALYAAGATTVAIHDIVMLPTDNWAPYGETLLVDLPEDRAQRREVFDLVEEIGRPDDQDGPVIDCGQSTIRLWWD
jgi:hypothetical protein